MKETELVFTGNEFWNPTKPTAKIIGENGNVYNIIGIARKALIKAGLKEKADEMQSKVFSSGSYDEALQIIMEYVEVE